MRVMGFSTALVFLAVAALTTNAQSVGEATPQEIVTRARERVAIYLDTFTNLLSQEKKTFEIYEKNGRVKKTKVVESTFLVYRLSKDQAQVTEFRNVVSVDGKRVANVDERAKDFFEKVVASQDSKAEFARIRDESSRFDEDFAIDGLTLFQAIALSNELRGKFRFTLASRESIGGRNVYVVIFDQIRPDPSVAVNLPSASHNYDIELDGGRDIELNARVRGKLWIDTDTFNIRRELRERTIQPAGFAEPIVVAEDLLEYTDSGFGILTPQTLSHLQYRVVLKDRQVAKDTRILFEYGKFTRPDVDVKGEVKDGTPERR